MALPFLTYLAVEYCLVILLVKLLLQTYSTIDELIEVVRQLFAETKSRWWFRGHTDATWELLPKMRRGCSPQMERYLTNLFYQRAKLRHANFPPGDDYAGWLAVMQHHGLPTLFMPARYRFLDCVNTPSLN